MWLFHFCCLLKALNNCRHFPTSHMRHTYANAATCPKESTRVNFLKDPKGQTNHHWARRPVTSEDCGETKRYCVCRHSSVVARDHTRTNLVGPIHHRCAQGGIGSCVGHFHRLPLHGANRTPFDKKTIGCLYLLSSQLGEVDSHWSDTKTITLTETDPRLTPRWNEGCCSFCRHRGKQFLRKRVLSSQNP